MRSNTRPLAEPLLGHEVVNSLVPLQPLLDVDEKIDAVNHALHELHFRKAEAI